MRLPAIIQTNRLMKSFGTEEVIKDCSISVAQGTIYGLLGANGAGKTTMLKLLTGLLTPDSGTVEILESDMAKHRNEMLVQIGSMIETPVFYDHLSAQKNLDIHLAYMGVCGFDVKKVLQMVGLNGAADKIVSKFSMGMRQRLGIARALIHRPKILILDEPINGLDPMGIKELRELFLRCIQENDMTILISSHSLSEMENTADRIGIIANGHMLCESDLVEIKNSYEGSLEDYYFSITCEGD